MIIIKTNNGDRFINEAETLQVSHIKDRAQVEVVPPNRPDNHVQQFPYIIEHVESVIYTTQETKWKDEGSELETLKTENFILEDRIARLQEKLRDFGCEL